MSAEAATTVEAVSGWTLTAVGWSVLLILPLALFAAWAIRRLYAGEVAGVGSRARRWLLGLRATAVFLLVLFLVEPSCTRVSHLVERPLVAVLVDDSQSMATTDASMAAHHRLDEAVALGFVPSELRDRSVADLGQAVQQAADLLVRLPAALVRAEDDHDELVDDCHTAIAELEERLVVIADVSAEQEQILQVVVLLQQAYQVFEPDDDVPVAQRPVAAAVADRCEPLRLATLQTITALRDMQRARDAALVHAAEPDSALATGLAAFEKLSRFERAAMTVDQLVYERLADATELRVHRLQRTLPDLDPTSVTADDLAGLTDRTDPATPLRSVAQLTGGRTLAGVVMVGDGRFTAGGDPRQAARTLQARGAVVAGVTIGDPDSPRDAVVGAILGATEVYKDETIRLDVRFRITGYPDQGWDLVLTRDGKEVEVRPVTGTGSWQQERFEFPATEPGIDRVIARLQPTAAPAVSAQTGITWRRYAVDKGVNQMRRVDRTKILQGEPVDERILTEVRAPSGIGDHYVAHWSGMLVPEQTGSYRFAVCGDDEVQFWLSTDARVMHRTLVAQTSEWTAPDEWTKEKSQTSAPIALRAGEAYWFELLHLETLGDDHAAIAVQLPDGTWQRPMPIGLFRPTAEAAAAPADDVKEPADTDLLPESSLDNNQAQIAITVNEDPMRVLLLDAQPRWDSRYLVSLFERDQRVTVDRRYLRIRQPRGEQEFVPAKQDDLDRYDMVVLGDVRPDELLPEDQQRLAEFVTARGGFMIVLAGPRGMPGAFNLGPLADIMPVVAQGERGDVSRRDHHAPLQLTEAGEDHPITLVLDDPSLNKQLWPALPSPAWVARGYGAKAGADVLVQSEDRQTPVVVLGRAGAGRVVFLGTDETWRWRDRLGDRIHQAFWLQTLRWGLAERLRGADPRLQVSLDRSIMEPDQIAEVRARVVLEDGTVVTVPPTIALMPLAPDGSPLAADMVREQLAPVADVAGLWRHGLADLAEGDYRIQVSLDHPALQGLVEERHLVVRRRAGLESVELAADPAAMRRLAAAGGGQSATLAGIDTVLDDLAERIQPKRTRQVQTTSLWNTYWALLIVVALLMAEWLIRKRAGLP